MNTKKLEREALEGWHRIKDLVVEGTISEDEAVNAHTRHVYEMCHDIIRQELMDEKPGEQSEWQIKLRYTSNQDWFPWTDRDVTFIRINPNDHVICQAKTKAQKRDLILSALPSDLLLAAWPGKWSQDIFLINDIKQARDVLL